MPLLLVHKFLEPRRLPALPGLPRRRLPGATLASAALVWDCCLAPGAFALRVPR